MEGSHKWRSSTSTPNQSPSPSVLKGSVENSQINEEIMESNVHNQKKSRPSPKKHFMSPTISAASKANPPRKKCLAERNESIDTTPLQKTQNFDSRAAEFGENKQNPLADSLSTSSPYDPLTNYLSPRPRFLRYDPNRRQEILLRRKNGIKEVSGGLSVSGSGSFSSKKVLDGEEDTSSSCGSLFMHYPEDNLNQEEGETDHSDEEIDQWAEEEKGWGLRGVLRFLLLLVVLVLSTSYISSMNSSNPSPVVQAVDGFRNEYQMVHDHVHGYMKSLESGNYSLVETEGTSMYFVRRIGVEEMIEDVKMIENSDGFIESECALSEAMDIVELVEDRAIGKSVEIVEVKGEDNEFVSHSEIVEAGEVSDNVEVNSDLEGTGAVETSESAFMLYGFNPRIILSDTADMNYNKGNEAVNESQEQEVIGKEMGAVGNNTDDCEERGAPIDEPEDSFHMLFLYQKILKSLLAILIAGALSYPIFFTLFSYLDSMSKRNAKKQSTSANAKSCSEPMTGQKCNSVPVNAEDKHIEHSVLIMNSGPSVNSVEEDTWDNYQSQAPIELLGEFVVEETSSSRRSHRVKSRVEKRTDSKIHSFPGREQPDFSEISTMDSASHGTFADKKIIVKKPDGTDGEDRKVAITPVRRSSRICKRSIVSP